MKIANNATITSGRTVVAWGGIRVWGAQTALVAAVVLLPALAHWEGLPVRWLLPMHWPVLFAGVIYGWRGGLLVGALAPASNWLITGYPLPPVLPAMTLELAAYGVVAGWLRERHGWNGFAATGAALVAGRLVFIATVWMTTGYSGPFGTYLAAAMAPGLVAGAAQAGVMGMIGNQVARKW